MNSQLLARLKQITETGLPIIFTKGRVIHPENSILAWLGDCPEFVSRDLGKLVYLEGLNQKGIRSEIGAGGGNITEKNHPNLYRILCKAMGSTPKNDKFSKRYDLDLHQWYDSDNNTTYSTILPSLRFALQGDSK